MKTGHVTTGHVTIAMEEKPRNEINNWEINQMKNEIKQSKDEIKSRSSLKHYYLGCSCRICYQRYKFSKKPHSCNAKDRCHVDNRQKIEDLEAVDTGKNNASTEMLPSTTIETECELIIANKRDLCQVRIPQSYNLT